MQKMRRTTILIKYLNRWMNFLNFRTFSKCVVNQCMVRIQKYDNMNIAPL